MVEDATWVSRAQLRLLQPPWHDDLEEEEIVNITASTPQPVDPPKPEEDKPEVVECEASATPRSGSMSYDTTLEKY